MVSATRLPVIVQPNAGLPTSTTTGNTVFPGTPDEMGAFADAARDWPACRGHRLVLRLDAGLHRRDRRRRRRQATWSTSRVAGFADTVLAGPRRIVTLGAGSPVRVIGERINPTGKPALKESLLAGSMSVVRSYAAEQEAAGADLLDVNVGAAGVDAVSALPAAVLALVGTADAAARARHDRSRRARGGAAHLSRAARSSTA